MAKRKKSSSSKSSNFQSENALPKKETRDRTKRKSAKERLIESESRLRASEERCAELHRTLENEIRVQTAELQRKEQELFQMRKLEAIGRLAGGIAHDFNNLLTGIIGCSETLEEMVTGDAERLEIAEIKKAAERAAALTKQLLAFGRRQVMAPRPVQLNDAIVDMSTALKRLIGDDVKLEVALDPALGDVLADLGQLDQVIMNIAVNSRDAMPQGGVLRIETANVSLDPKGADTELASGDYVMVTIADTGAGMSPDVQSHIFEPFFTTKEQVKGAGLGLATAHGIVRQMNGAILVESNEGKGSTFKILLPRSPTD